MKTVFSLFLLLLALPGYARDFTCQDTYRIVVAGAASHLNNPQVDAALVKKSLLPYLELRDNDKILLTTSEENSLNQEFSAKAEATYLQLQKGDCSGYNIVDAAIERGRERWKTLTQEVLQENVAMAPEVKRRDDGGEVSRFNSPEEIKAYLRHLLNRYISVELAKNSPKSPEAKLAKSEEAKKKFGRRYLNEKKRSRTEKERQAVNIAKAIFLSFDPHSAYIAADEVEEMKSGISTSMDGIGLILQEDEFGSKVRSVIPGGPVDKSQRVKTGDYIVKVNGEDTSQMVLTDVVRKIRGKKGTKVKVTFSREDKTTKKISLFEISITRDSVALEDQKLKTKVISEGGKKILIFNLPSFYADSNRQVSATGDMIDAYRQAKSEGVIDGLVLDLRANPGGLLDEAVRITGLFIDKPLSVQVKNANGSIQLYKSRTAPVLMTEPLTVLISKSSASASEIVAGALKDYGRAVIAGDERTYGKGTIQVIANGLEAQGLGSFKVTTGKFYTPAGGSTQNRGVLADIVIPSATEVMDIGEKNQLYALEYTAVPSAFKSPVVTRVTTVLSELAKNSKVRVAAEAEFKKYADLAAFKKWRQAEEEKEANEEVGETRNRFDLTKDLVLQEGVKIELDLIERTKNSSLPVAAANP